MLKWIITCVVVVMGLAFMWYLGVLQEIGGAFKGWLRWIGSY